MADTTTTRPSLLLHIRDCQNGTAWSQFVDIYLPLIYGYVRKHGLQDADAADLAQEVLHTVARVTPVDADNRPDLDAVESACRTVGALLEPGAIVVLESTVYPGVTEKVCGPILEQASGLSAGRDFFLGYSPERMNPGDREHTVQRITKVVAGQTPEIAERLADIYRRMTAGGVYVARDIMTAEAAKVIENAQRDINIAFMNEVAVIFQRLGLSMHDVLDAARTKWNFLDFQPGLVGGHCIGVDPYYLAHVAREAGHDPQVILAGRRINDAMSAIVAHRIAAALDGAGIPSPARMLVLGLTFKENVPDVRNSKVVDLVGSLRDQGHDVSVHDPLADHAVARREFGIELLPDLAAAGPFDALVGAVPHDDYRRLDMAAIERLVVPGGLLADIKGIWRGQDLPDTITYWSL